MTTSIMIVPEGQQNGNKYIFKINFGPQFSNSDVKDIDTQKLVRINTKRSTLTPFLLKVYKSIPKQGMLR